MMNSAVRTGAVLPDSAQPDVKEPDASAPYLAPVERPKGFVMRLAYYFVRRRFGRVFGPLSVFSARMPLAFTLF